MRLYAAICLSTAGSLAHAQSASPQTAPSPWSLHRVIEAPDAFKLSATLRVRHDSIDGQPRPGFNPSDEAINVRTTVFAEYDSGPVRFGAELYDSRSYLADARTPISTNEVNALEFVQAYAALDLNGPFGAGSKATLQVGRFVLNLGSRRLVAADDFRNTTNGYTGLRADVTLTRSGPLRATFIYVLPQVRLPDDPVSVLDNRPAPDREGFDAVLWGGIITRGAGRGRIGAEVSAFRFIERDRVGRSTRDRNLTTIGGRLFREPEGGKFDFEVEGFYQFGRTSDGTAPAAARLDVSATFFHADLGYTFVHKWRPRISLRFDRVSGDESGPVVSRFDTLFGMRRAEIAPSGLYNAVGRANLLSPAVRLEAVPDASTDVFVHYRPLWLASRTDSFSTSGVRDASGRSGNFAGHQFELRLRRWLVRDALRFELGALYLAKGRFMRAAPNGPATGNSRYINLTMTAFF